MVQPQQSFTLGTASYIALVIAAFLLGYFYAKIQYYESGEIKETAVADTKTVPTQAPAKNMSAQTLKTWAKQIGLDEKKFSSCLDSGKYKKEVINDSEDGKTAGVTGTPTVFVNGIKIVGAQPFSAFKDIIDKELNGTAQAEKVNIEPGNNPFIGNASAPVTIVEFSDLQCPFCRKFWSDAYSGIKREYIDTGKAKFYFRHFILEFHSGAVPMGEAIECANEQGKFWEMRNKIFTEQEKIDPGRTIPYSG
jgi:protein-disulfide isomerase